MTYIDYGNDIIEPYSLGSYTSSDDEVYLTAGSSLSYVIVTLTPYNQNGTAGESIVCRGDAPAYFAEQSQPDSGVISDVRYGVINTHGGGVAGFTTAYVTGDAAAAHVRDSLGNMWHIKSVNTYYSYGIQWYELYDADDGDYYGWVDEYYIDFYGE